MVAPLVICKLYLHESALVTHYAVMRIEDANLTLACFLRTRVHLASSVTCVEKKFIIIYI